MTLSNRLPHFAPVAQTSSDLLPATAAAAATSTAVAISLLASRVFRSQSTQLHDDFLGDFGCRAHGIALIPFGDKTYCLNPFEGSRLPKVTRHTAVAMPSATKVQSQIYAARFPTIHGESNRFRRTAETRKGKTEVVKRATAVIRETPQIHRSHFGSQNFNAISP
jgi:hypothetical protein